MIRDNTKFGNLSKEAIAKIEEVEAKEKEGYLLRGEPKHYQSVTSSLYRAICENGLVAPQNLEYHEDMLVAFCLCHCDKDLNLDFATAENWKSFSDLHKIGLQKLSEMQHLGGETNLIDFTTCHRCALFFACDKNPEEDGRIIVIPPGTIPCLDTDPCVTMMTESPEYNLRYIGYPPERAETQKSVFVHAKRGYLDSDLYEKICVPSEQKKEILDWLSEKRSDRRTIDRRTMYPDTIGFIQYRERLLKSKDYRHLAEHHLFKTRMYRYAIEACKKSTNENPSAYVYHLWGIAYLQLGKVNESIKKFDRALEHDEAMASKASNEFEQGYVCAVAQAARNIAEGNSGEYPTLAGIFSLNYNLWKGYPNYPGFEEVVLHMKMFDTSFNLTKRWHSLNVFYSYDELWNALPQTLVHKPQDRKYFSGFFRRLQPDEIENPLKA